MKPGLLLFLIFSFFNGSVLAESASMTISSLRSMEEASRQRRAVCEKIKNDPNCVGRESMLRQSVGLNVAGCTARIQSLKCDSFFQKFPEYQNSRMRCEPYEVCKLSLESTTAEGCRRFGIQLKDGVIAALKSQGECATRLSCIGVQALGALFPAMLISRAATATVQSVRDDVDKLKQIGCLDPETQAQFQCYLLASYGGLAAGGVGGVASRGAGIMARMASLKSKMLRSTRPPPLPVRPPTAPRLTALEDFTRATGRQVRLQEFPGNQGYAVVDSSGTQLFKLKYGLRSDANGELYFNKVDVGVNPQMSEGLRRNGFYSYTMNRMFRANPTVKKIKADLQSDNAAVVNSYVSRGYSVEEAIRQTPSYRVYQQNGFTRIDTSSVRVNRSADGQIVQVEYFASKP